MMISNLQQSEEVFKNIQKVCIVKFSQYSHNCQDCRYRHKGICNVSFESNSDNYNNDKSKNLEEKIEIMTQSRLVDSEPALNLKDLFYEVNLNENIKISAKNFPQKAKYDNFKLLTDIQRVLQRCTHLTSKDRLNYCNTQRYFMKLYLREINKPE